MSRCELGEMLVNQWSWEDRESRPTMDEEVRGGFVMSGLEWAKNRRGRKVIKAISRLVIRFIGCCEGFPQDRDSPTSYNILRYYDPCYRMRRTSWGRSVWLC